MDPVSVVTSISNHAFFFVKELSRLLCLKSDLNSLFSHILPAGFVGIIFQVEGVGLFHISKPAVINRSVC